MNMASKFNAWRNSHRTANKLNRISGHQLNDMGLKRFITTTGNIRFI